jgi:hypothetical protein
MVNKILIASPNPDGRILEVARLSTIEPVSVSTTSFFRRGLVSVHYLFWKVNEVPDRRDKITIAVLRGASSEPLLLPHPPREGARVRKRPRSLS